MIYKIYNSEGDSIIAESLTEARKVADLSKEQTQKLASRGRVRNGETSVIRF